MDIREELINACGALYVSFDEPMSKHTTFRVGGNADYFVKVTSAEQLASGIRLCNLKGVPVTVLGNGSNVLVSDRGIRGAVFELGRDFSDITISREDDDILVTAEAGAVLSNVGARLLKEGIYGFHWASGIPGSVGGAVYMNAGAYGGEMAQVIVSVRGVLPGGETAVLGREELEYGYRHSAIPEKGLLITEATLELTPGEPGEIRAKMADYNSRRAEKQPLDVPSAGSTFKRPEGAFAAALIDQCGLKGYAVGGARVSPKHAGFLVNTGSSAADYLRLVREVQRIVELNTGFRLVIGS